MPLNDRRRNTSYTTPAFLSCPTHYTMAVPLRLAVCLYPGLTALDYQGPVELFGFISSKSLNSGIGLLPLPQPYTIETTFLSHDMEPVEPSSGPRVLPDASYIDDVGQFDIVLVPGGKWHLPYIPCTCSIPNVEQLPRPPITILPMLSYSFWRNNSHVPSTFWASVPACRF
jgi:hypothetical protein